MNIILGATGRVGAMVAEHLLKAKQPIKVIVRDPRKAKHLKDKGAIIQVADYLDKEAMKSAFQGSKKAFLVTPENPFSKDVMNDASIILQNYYDAVKQTGIEQIIGLSSFGAQHSSGTGNLEISHKLEHVFDDLDIEKKFIRPSYYYSNWLGYYNLAKENGILPTFFPAEQKIPMISPADVASFVFDVFMEKVNLQRINEITGPKYSANDIATIFSKALNKEITTVQIEQTKWQETLEQNGFTGSGAYNLAMMINAVVTGKTQPEGECVFLETTFETYLKENENNV